jgi:putative acetyltransferase
MAEIRIVPAGGEEIRAVQELWREYWDRLGLAADFQNFAREVESLPGVYAEPDGRLLLAFRDGEPAGTAALRRLNGHACEAKRLYVRPRFQGAGIGRALLTRLREEARAAGYREMYGDTLDSMQAALDLYCRFGFRRVEAYSEHPTPGAIFLRLKL